MSNRKENKDKVKESPVTYEVYAEMPDDGNRYEILDGELEMMSPGPSTVHQGVSGKLYLLTQSCAEDYVIFMAPLDIILTRTNVLQPDLVMIHRDRLDIVAIRGIEGAPDLVVEVLSPSSRKRDKVRKAGIYARHGVPEYWIIDAWARTLERYVLSGEHYVIADLFEEGDKVVSDKLPCVSFTVGELLQDPVVRKLLT